MKRILAGTAAALLAAVSFMPQRVSAVSARKAIVVDPISERVLYQKDADSRSLIASTTKIMTALLVCEQCNVLDRVRISKEAVGIEGSSMYLQEGEILSIQELLYGLMLSSGNDAAVALAIYCGGNVEGFVEMMNDKARNMGMAGTHFANPNGLDHPDHYSTARDLSILASYAMKNPIFQKTVSTKTVTIGQRFLRNHNKLLWRYPGADGIKTGFTKAAGRILVSSAVHDNRRIIAVTIDDPNDWADHTSLYEDAFHSYNLQRVVTMGDHAGFLEVENGTKKFVPLLASDNYVYSVAEGETPQLVLPGGQFAYAPVEKGADAGIAYVLIGDTAIGTVNVVYGETVELQQEKKGILKRLFGGAGDD